MASGEGGLARASAEQARAAGREADAPWVVADALVTLGLLAERGGRVKTAIASYSRALAQARRAGVLGVELRAAFQVARIHLERGNLDAASMTAHDGMTAADRAGLGMAPYGFDLQYLHYLAHFSDGDWDHAQEIVDGFAVRVSSEAEARLSAMALFIAVAQGSDAVETSGGRGWRPSCAWMPSWPTSRSACWPSTRCWQGDLDSALAEMRAHVTAALAWGGKQSPQLIRVAAVRLAAVADLAVQARAAGDSAREQELVEEAGRVVELARSGAGDRRPAADQPRRRRPGLAGPRRGRVPPRRRATTIPATGRRCWTRSGPASCMTRPGPAGGWPRRWLRRATGTRPRSSGRWPWPPPTSWAPRRCAAAGRAGPAAPAEPRGLRARARALARQARAAVRWPG